MDIRTEQAIEATLEAELIYNERVVTHPKFGKVRIKRPTPAEERLISEARRRQYHADLKDDAILSKDEIEAIAIRRGMWSPALTARLKDLTRRTGEAMAILDTIGFESFDDLMASYGAAETDLTVLFGENEEIRPVIRRYFSLGEKPAIADRSAIIDAAPSSRVDDVLEKAEGLRVQIEVLEEMLKLRSELWDLQMKQTRLYVDSLESRSDRAEELAKVYYCMSQAESGGRLWPTVDEIWNAEAEDIEILILEFHYFVHGTTDQTKEAMAKYGFIKRLTDTKPSSESSPVQPQSNSDGESPESEPTASSPDTE